MLVCDEADKLRFGVAAISVCESVHFEPFMATSKTKPSVGFFDFCTSRVTLAAVLPF
jgi:hypothetical protein